ncbi:MAG: hypothetical protein LBN00_06270 [Oscillospiraceae bacterium]|jgi:hypothetical protein|nr:hypothetical protein [Oscillospiraceae bacterium]
MAHSKSEDARKQTPAAKSAFSFPTSKLITSKRFSNYQQDFLRALLTAPSYTVEEAEKIVKNYFEKGR